METIGEIDAKTNRGLVVLSTPPESPARASRRFGHPRSPQPQERPNL